ncbi:MAG: hypothetical protein QXX91_06110 [Thermoplasmata archaeon]
MQTDLAPIVLFVYNRPWHARQTLEALSKNLLADKSKLFIYADGPKENTTKEQLVKIKEVKKLISEKQWCAEVQIVEREKNLGLGNSVIAGVTEIVNKFGKIIVLEDDLITSVGFLKYMNDALNFYENEERVMHVSGYMFPVKNAEEIPETFFLNLTSCWGWGTWARAWGTADFNSMHLLDKIGNSERISEFVIDNSTGFYSLLQQNAVLEQKNKTSIEIIRNDSKWNWDICWYATVFLQEGLCLHPRLSLVRNIGHDNQGVHCKSGWWSRIYNQQKITDYITVQPIELKKNVEASKAVESFYKKLAHPPLWVRAKEKFKLVFNSINTFNL